MRYSPRLISTRDLHRLIPRLREAGVSPAGADIVSRKIENLVILLEEVPPAAANIIKQQLLSLGGDAAVHRDVITGKPEKSTAYLIADERRFSRLAEKLAGQPFALGE
ncbi:MAG: dihydropteroate synthase, partial [Candidatus Krumholzibacteriota bacterium]|nr:dihydropteroate synthase [Candidatus Krumholzibacteriota bacterium]